MLANESSAWSNGKRRFGALALVLLCTMILFSLTACGKDEPPPEGKDREELVDEVYRLKEENYALRADKERLAMELETVGQRHANETKSSFFVWIAICIVGVGGALFLGAGLGAKTRDAAIRQHAEKNREVVPCQTTEK